MVEKSLADIILIGCKQLWL